MRKLYIAAVLLTACTSGCSKKNPAPEAQPPAPAPATQTAVPAPVKPTQPEVQVAADPSVAAAAQPSNVHIWTSIDGRKLEAELIARTTDTITVRRASDRKEFTIHLASISTADQDYASLSTIPLTFVKAFDAKKLASLKTRFPPLTPNAPLKADNPILKDTIDRYERGVAAISPIGYARHIEMLKDQMASDMKRLEPIAATQLKNPPVYINGVWTTGSGAWQETWAARSTLSWLKGPLADYVRSLEGLK